MKNYKYMPPLMFRITTNSIKYRIEVLCKVGYLWWKRREWIPLGRNLYLSDDWHASEYKSLQAAETELDLIIKEVNEETRVALHGWQPIGNTIRPEKDVYK